MGLQKEKKEKAKGKKQKRNGTSSSFLQMRLNALKMASVVPVMVTIRSGQDPSDMLMRAPD